MGIAANIKMILLLLLFKPPALLGDAVVAVSFPHNINRGWPGPAKTGHEERAFDWLPVIVSKQNLARRRTWRDRTHI
jgi:hypothetical protein